MNSFEYAAPKRLRDATEMLGSRWGETEVMAGGTDLVTSLKQGITSPKRVISLRNIDDLKEIKSNRRGFLIGSMVTLEELAKHSAVENHFPALATAIQNIGSAQMISVGTVGGDLCQRPRCWFYRNGYGLLAQKQGKSLVREGDNRYHAIFGNEGPALYVHPSSLAPILIALGAKAVVVGPDRAKREVDLAAFYQTPTSEDQRETVLAPNEILTQIQVPKDEMKNGVYEVRHRFGLDWPYVTAAVAFKLARNGTASDSRVVLGQVAPQPWSAPEAARVLDGNKINETISAQCGEAAAQGAKPLSGNAYKVAMVKAATKRAIQAAIS